MSEILSNWDEAILSSRLLLQSTIGASMKHDHMMTAGEDDDDDDDDGDVFDMSLQPAIYQPFCRGY